MGRIEKNTAGRGNADDATSLIARLRNGEPQALSELHDRYAKVVYALAFRGVASVIATVGIGSGATQRI
jgi:hypothetical protein